MNWIHVSRRDYRALRSRDLQCSAGTVKIESGAAREHFGSGRVYSPLAVLAFGMVGVLG